MTRLLAALALVLASAAARAGDSPGSTAERGSVPAPESAIAPGARPSDQAALRDSRVAGEHQMFHVGVLLGIVSLPRPLDGEVFVRIDDLVSLGFSYSDFPNFVASPLLDAIGANSGTTQARLDDFSAYEGDLRVYPFRGAFFVGSSIGHQSLKGAVTDTSTGISQTGTADVQTLYATPRVGFLWTWDSGFLLGLDAGVQFKLSSDIHTVYDPPNPPANVSNNVNNLVDAGTSYPLPSFHFRIGWQY